MHNIFIIFSLIQRMVLIKFRDRFDLINIIFVPIMIGASTAFVLKYTPMAEDYSLMSNDKFVHFLFLSIIIIIFISLTNSVREIISNKVYILKEKRSGVLLSNYFIATFLVLALISLIQTILYIVVASFVIELHDSFYVFFIWLYLSAIAATSFGLFISAIANSEITATLTVPLILIPQIILGGGMITFEQINKDLFIKNISIEDKNRAIPAISQVMISKWATEGLFVQLNNHLKEKRDSLSKFCKEDYFKVEKSAKNEYFNYIEGAVSQKQKKEKFNSIQSVITEAKQKLDKCTAPANNYLNGELNALIIGAKSDFESAFIDDNYAKSLAKVFEIGESSFVSFDAIEIEQDKKSIINTFSSETKYFFSTYLKTEFFNKIIMVMYSLFFLSLSFLSLRRI